jgi:hypothetical protein
MARKLIIFLTLEQDDRNKKKEGKDKHTQGN